jgi:hypothetical protein
MNSTTDLRPDSPGASPQVTFPWPAADFEANRSRIPESELAKWSDQHVAWSWDGTRIVAGAETLAALQATLRDARVDPTTVVFDYIESLKTPSVFDGDREHVERTVNSLYPGT